MQHLSAGKQIEDMVRKKASAKVKRDVPIYIHPQFQPLTPNNISRLLPGVNGADKHALVLGEGEYPAL
jgi:hypothetical protein